MTTAAETADRMAVEGDLEDWLHDSIRLRTLSLVLGGQEYVPVEGKDVPGYEDEDHAVLLRRKSDGKVFEVAVNVALDEAIEYEPEVTA